MPCNEMVRLLKNLDSSSEISLDESSVSDKSAAQRKLKLKQHLLIGAVVCQQWVKHCLPFPSVFRTSLRTHELYAQAYVKVRRRYTPMYEFML